MSDIEKEIEKYHPSTCDRYEILRGIYPNDRRQTGKPCSCGFEQAIAHLINEAIIYELDNKLLWQAKRLCNAGEASKVTKNWFWKRIEDRIVTLQQSAERSK